MFCPEGRVSLKMFALLTFFRLSAQVLKASLIASSTISPEPKAMFDNADDYGVGIIFTEAFSQKKRDSGQSHWKIIERLINNNAYHTG